jgi:hypothetical protein
VAQASQNRPSPWLAFAAGAVAMLILAVIWGAWLSRAGAGRVVRAAAEATTDLPLFKTPHLPQSPPRLPDAPVPQPK